MFAEKFNSQFPRSDSETGLKKAKLGIDDIGVEKSTVSDPQLLWKENPPDAKQGVDGSMRYEENDDLQVTTGDWVSQIIGDPVLKLMSSFLAMSEEEKGVVSDSPQRFF